MKHDTLLDILAKEATKSDCGFKHAACIVHKNKILSIGYNHYISHVKKGDTSWKLTTHAERDCLSKLPYYYRRNKNLIMYVIRVNNNGEFRLSEPCSNCKNYIEKYNINTVLFSK